MSMKPEAEHMIQTLRSAIRVLGFTYKDIEGTIGVSGGYITRLFNGTLELRFEHVIDIGRALGLEPAEVFQLAYPHPRNPPSAAAQRLRATFPPPSYDSSVPSPPPVAPAHTGAPNDSAISSALEQEMERMMKKVFSRFFLEFMAESLPKER
jgi:hypothetical protein